MQLSLKHILQCCVAALVSCFIGWTCGAVPSQELKDSLRREASKAVTYQKKIALLYDILDLSEDRRDPFLAVNREILALAEKQKDEHVQLDCIRRLQDHNIDSTSSYIAYVSKLPVTDEQREVAIYFDYQQTISTMKAWKEKDKSEMIAKMTHDYSTRNSSDDIYSRYGQLLNICAVMSSLSSSNLYLDYLKQLGELSDKLPSDGGGLLADNFYTLSAITYPHFGMQKEALEANRQILKDIDAMERKYLSEGRKYKNMDKWKYVCYRRMLQCKDVLSSAEIDDLFARMSEIANRNPYVNGDFDSDHSISKIRYYMAKERYSEAIPLLDSLILSKNAATNSFRSECLGYRMTAGKAIKDDPELLRYSLLYNDLLQRQRDESVDTKAKELQIVYNVNNLERQLNDMKLERENIVIASVSAVAVLAVALLIILSVMLAKNKKLKNEAIQSSLIKSAFIRNINHEIRTPLNSIVGFSRLIADNGDGMDSAELAKYDSIIESNCDSMLQMVDDLLSVSDLESGVMKFTLSPCSLNELCENVIGKREYSLSPGVKMSFVPKEKDTVISTDRQRVSQVLAHFLSNACKFTKQGEITLEYALSNSPDKVVFSVTDTGIGIPADKAGVIFGQFEKIDDFTQGTGIGLSMCSLIAKRLGGKISLDTSYTGGARFLLTIPAEA